MREEEHHECPLGVNLQPGVITSALPKLGHSRPQICLGVGKLSRRGERGADGEKERETN